jgi:ankyrin repeat protein
MKNIIYILVFIACSSGCMQLGQLIKIETHKNVFFRAISAGDFPEVQRLIRNENNINEEVNGITPLFYAIYKKNLSLVKEFLAANANLNCSNHSAFCYAAGCSSGEIVAELMAHEIKIHGNCANQGTALMYSIIKKNESATAELLKIPKLKDNYEKMKEIIERLRELIK